MAAPRDNKYDDAWENMNKQTKKKDKKKVAAWEKELKNEQRRAAKAQKQREDAAKKAANAQPPPPSPPQSTAKAALDKRQQMLKILGSPRDTIQDIRRAYHVLALRYHPDKCGSDARFKEILTAYEYLSGI